MNRRDFLKAAFAGLVALVLPKGKAAVEQETLFGYPVVEWVDAPEFGQSPIVLDDFGYLPGDKLWINYGGKWETIKNGTATLTNTQGDSFSWTIKDGRIVA